MKAVFVLTLAFLSLAASANQASPGPTSEFDSSHRLLSVLRAKIDSLIDAKEVVNADRDQLVDVERFRDLYVGPSHSNPLADFYDSCVGFNSQVVANTSPLVHALAPIESVQIQKLIQRNLMAHTDWSDTDGHFPSYRPAVIELKTPVILIDPVTQEKSMVQEVIKGPYCAQSEQAACRNDRGSTDQYILVLRSPETKSIVGVDYYKVQYQPDLATDSASPVLNWISRFTKKNQVPQRPFEITDRAGSSPLEKEIIRSNDVYTYAHCQVAPARR